MSPARQPTNAADDERRVTGQLTGRGTATRPELTEVEREEGASAREWPSAHALAAKIGAIAKEECEMRRNIRMPTPARRPVSHTPHVVVPGQSQIERAHILHTWQQVDGGLFHKLYWSFCILT
jgi:hypothetical protein